MRYYSLVGRDRLVACRGLGGPFSRYFIVRMVQMDIVGTHYEMDVKIISEHTTTTRTIVDPATESVHG